MVLISISFSYTCFFAALLHKLFGFEINVQFVPKTKKETSTEIKIEVSMYTIYPIAMENKLIY